MQKGNKNNKHTYIAEIQRKINSIGIDNQQSNIYTLTGIIGNIIHDKQVYYMACVNCKKKVNGEKCTNCDKDMGIQATYIFNMIVTDGTGSVTIHVFGNIGDEILGKTAGEIKEMKEKGDEQFNKVFDDAKIGVK